MKIFTYLRTLWHEFWMRSIVGPPTPEVKPLEANAGLLRMNQKFSDGMNRANNITPTWDFGSMLVKFEKKLWVYNASRVDHKFDHPMLGDVTIPANKTRKRYSLWTSFPEVVMGTNYNMDTNELIPNMIKGEYFVNDLINPDRELNITVGGITSPLITSLGRDLSTRGVFWSYSNPPKPSEVNAAVKKMKTRYANLLEKEKVLEETLRRKDVPENITPELHAAAEYFKVTTPWHPVLHK